MDKPDDMKRILETLRLETLEDLPLTHLFEAIERNIPADVDKRRILDIYVMWLHPRLMAIDVSAKGYLGLEVFYLYHFLKALPGDHSRLADAFHDWQCSQAVGNADISTKVRIAETEFRRLMPTHQNKPLERSTDPLMPEDRFGKMHPDRAKLSQDTRMVIELDDDEDDDDIILVSSKPKWRGRGWGRGNGSGGRPGLSFLTGSNKLPMNGKAKITHEINSEGPGASEFQGKPVSKPKSKSVSKSATSANPPKSKVAGGPQRLHKEYVCSRCKMKGDHIFTDCPILDPSLDKKLPRAYICQICKGGDHHISVCPFNMDLESMTQRSMASVKHNGHPSDRRRGGPREYRPAEARDRSRSPLRELEKHIGKDAHGPPKENSSGSQTLAQNPLRKRKASPLPPTSRKRGTQAKEISISLSGLPSSKAKQPSEEVQQPCDDEANERHENNSRANDHQPPEPIRRKKRARAKKTRGSLRVLPSSKVKQSSEEVRLSYDGGADERHESNSRANDHQVSELISRNRRTRAKKIRDGLMALSSSKVKQPSEEVRQSYDDEADERRERNSRANDHQPSGLALRGKATPAREIRGSRVVSPNLKVKELLKRRRVLSDGKVNETHEGNSRVNDQLFELAVLEMIRAESVKTDLLQLEPPSNAFSALSLKGQGSLLRANKTANKSRPYAGDFYDLRDGKEQLAEAIDAKMAADAEATREPERAPVLANPTVMEGEDAVMAEHEPETAIVVSTDAARLKMFNEGSFPSEQSPIVETKMQGSEAGIIVQPTNNEVLSVENVAKAAVSTAMTEKSNQAVQTGAFPDQFVAPEAIDAKETESLSPRPFNESDMEVEAATTAAKKLSTTSGEPVGAVAGPGVDTEMAEGQLSSIAEEPAAAHDCDM